MVALAEDAEHANRDATTAVAPYVARWDLDKTYLRTDFDTVRDLVRTAVERPDQKRTVPGAAALMRELSDAGAGVHILSGSPQQLRGRIVEKLRLDGVQFESLTLKPNLQNILRLRFKAIRGQLGYKLPSLLRRRCEMPCQTVDGELVAESLFGDDAEADAFVYSLYGDICAGRVDNDVLTAVMREGGCYDDDIRDALRLASYIVPGEVVERILIHLDRQTSPASFELYGPRVVPFYNYFQAAMVLFEDHRLPPRSLLRIAQELVVRHHFDGDTLARSFLELTRRGHATGAYLDTLAEDFATWIRDRRVAGASELTVMIEELERHHGAIPPPSLLPVELDYTQLVTSHNPRRHRRR